jgi:hypothetical protein
VTSISIVVWRVCSCTATGSFVPVLGVTTERVVTVRQPLKAMQPIRSMRPVPFDAKVPNSMVYLLRYKALAQLSSEELKYQASREDRGTSTVKGRCICNPRAHLRFKGIDSDGSTA